MVMLELSVYEGEGQRGRYPGGNLSQTTRSNQDEVAEEIFYKHLTEDSSCWPLFSWKTSAYQMSSGNTAEQ